MRSILIVLLSLAACAPVSEKIAAADHDTCSSWGLSTGTPDYVNCRLALRQQRLAEQASTDAMLGSMMFGNVGR